MFTRRQFKPVTQEGEVTKKKKWYQRRKKRCYDCYYEMQKALLGVFPIAVCINHRDGVRGRGFWFYPAVLISACIPGDGFTMMVYEGSYFKALWRNIVGKKWTREN
jgi:hypothetical protein